MFDQEPILAVRDKINEMHNLPTIAALEDWIHDNPYPVYYMGRIMGSVSWIRKPWHEVPGELRPVMIKLDVRWSPTIGNSHDAPRGQPTNFMRDPLKPLHFPGWAGYVRYSVPKEWGDFDFNRFLRHIRIFTGGGSGRLPRTDNYLGGEYSVNLFDDDYPMLAMTRHLTA